jgi:predicted ATPase/DNA-binding SARP family transcriptional activator
MLNFRVCLFGVPRFEREGKALNIRRRKAMAMLAYLAVTGQPHSRDSLATMFWPDYDQSSSRANLRRDLSRLKKELGDDVLDIEREQVAISPEIELWSDVDSFENDLKKVKDHDHRPEELCPECLSDLTEAVSLYSGEFMEGFSLPDSIAFDDWQFFQAESLRQSLAEALQTLIGWHCRQGEYESGIEYARRWLALDHLNEPAHRKLIELYALADQRSAAIRQYEECRRILQEELGLTPEEETAALHQAILKRRFPPASPAGMADEKPSLGLPPLRNLPVEATPFIGRTADLEALSELLSRSDVHMVTIVGLGGMGKTRLAGAVTRRLRQERASLFKDGLVFVPLEDVDSVEALPYSLAQKLNLTLAGKSDPMDEIATLLSDKDMLLVMDNFEQLLAGARLLNHILSRCPGIKLLVTSREPLRLEAEWRYDLDGLSYPSPEASNGENAYEAVELFVQTARQFQADFDLTDETRPHIYRLCQLVAGAPLAVKLAASWLRMMPSEMIADEVARNMDILTSHMRDIPHRQRSIRAIFTSTVNLLEEDERQVFPKLSVFRGGFTADASLVVADATPLVLLGLVDRGLLRLDTTRPGGRFYIHGLLRQYAAQELKGDSQEFARVVGEHSRYYAAFMAGEEQRLREGTISPQIAADIDNIRKGWTHAVEQREVQALEGYHQSLAIFYWLQSWVVEAYEIFSNAVSVLREHRQEPGIQELLVPLLVSASAHSQFRGRHARAGEMLEEALGLAEDVKRADLTATVLDRQARLANELGDYQLALDLGQEALDLFEQTEDEINVARMMGHLGAVNLFMQNYEMSQDQLQESAANLRGYGLKSELTVVLSNLALAKIKIGEFERAGEFLQEAVALSQQMGSPVHTTVMNSLGRVAEAEGDYKRARTHFEDSLEYCRKLGNDFWMATPLAYLGNLAWLEGDYQEAERRLGQSLDINREYGKTRQVARDMNMLGMVALARGELDLARKRFQNGYTIYEDLGNQEGMAVTLHGLGQVAHRLDKIDEALSRYLDALQLGYRIGAEPAVLQIALSWVRSLIQLGESEAAVTLLAFILARPTAVFQTRRQAEALLSEHASGLSPDLNSNLQEKGAALSIEAAVSLCQETARRVSASVEPTP